MAELSEQLAAKRDRLLAAIAAHGSAAVAFSAGVDSTVVAKAAALALGERAIAVTADSPALASGELEQSVELAQQIGIRHVVIEPNELANPGYAANAADRCYFCKTELYQGIEQRRGEWGVAVILNGANRDDLGDYRPGLQAAHEHAVRSPLAEADWTKAEIRQLAAAWQLPVWDKPATPCLASRVAYGEEVTRERLQMIDQAESFLRAQGWREVRVRYHRGDLARVELPADQLARLADAEFRQALVARLTEIGFRFITLDLAGFRSGSLNTVLPLESLSVRGSE